MRIGCNNLPHQRGKPLLLMSNLKPGKERVILAWLFSVQSPSDEAGPSATYIYHARASSTRHVGRLNEGRPAYYLSIF